MFATLHPAGAIVKGVMGAATRIAVVKSPITLRMVHVSDYTVAILGDASVRYKGRPAFDVAQIRSVCFTRLR